MEKNKSLIYEACFSFISPNNSALSLSFTEVSRLEKLLKGSNKRLIEFEETFVDKHLFFNPAFVSFFNIGDEIALSEIEKNENFGLKWNFSGWAKEDVVLQAINHEIELSSLNGFVFSGERVVIKIVGKEFVFNEGYPRAFLKCLIIEDFSGE